MVQKQKLFFGNTGNNNDQYMYENEVEKCYYSKFGCAGSNGLYYPQKCSHKIKFIPGDI